MIKKHTAQSLGKYIGKGVIEWETRYTYELTGINVFTNTIELHDGIYEFAYDFGNYGRKLFESFMPILKTYEKLIESMPCPFLYKLKGEVYFEGQEIIPAVLIYDIDFEDIKTDESIFDRLLDDFKYSPHGWLDVGLDYDKLDLLIQCGFGAIPNTESPTGYVDLFGYVCEVER